MIFTVVGARPQFIKAAAVSRALAAAEMREMIAHTGQHFDASMSGVFFSELGIPEPAYNLGIHSAGHGAMTGRMLEKLEAAMIAENPDVVLVYGDTNSTVAAAMAAAKLHIPVAHVEAGLRSFNKRMPEEINRIVTDHLSTQLYCPTKTAVANLSREGIQAGVHAVGDVMYDMCLTSAVRAEEGSAILETLDLAPESYAVATIHRAENTDDAAQFARVVDWLVSQSRERPVIMPLHPRTAKRLSSLDRDLAGLRIIEPVGYLDMTRLIHQSAAVFTDSGGLQKEAYFHRVPCVTLRTETEWVETIAAGWNRLWTSDGYEPRREIVDYGDGNASKKIASLISTLSTR